MRLLRAFLMLYFSARCDPFDVRRPLSQLLAQGESGRIRERELLDRGALDREHDHQRAAEAAAVLASESYSAGLAAGLRNFS